MSELNRFNPAQNNLVNYQAPKRQTYVTKRTARGIVEKVQLDKLDMDGDAALTVNAMDLVVNLDAHRVNSARTNEVNAFMYQLEAGFVARTAKKLNDRNSPFGF